LYKSNDHKSILGGGVGGKTGLVAMGRNTQSYDAYNFSEFFRKSILSVLTHY